MSKAKANEARSVAAAQRSPDHGKRTNTRDPSARGEETRKEDPRHIPGGQETRVPSAAAGSLDPLPSTPVEVMLPVPVVLGAGNRLQDYKGTPLRDIGRDPKTGKVIPHKRSERIARQIMQWVVGGYTLNDVAVALNLRPGLVKECYGMELRHGKDKVGMALTSHVLKRAKQSDNVLRFVMKAQYGWRDGESRPVDSETFNIHIHV